MDFDDRNDGLSDRSDPEAAGINRLRIVDAPLDIATANDTAAIVNTTRVSVADAHLRSVAKTTAGEVVVLTSDPDDTAKASAPTPITTIGI